MNRTTRRRAKRTTTGARRTILTPVHARLQAGAEATPNWKGWVDILGNWSHGLRRFPADHIFFIDTCAIPFVLANSQAHPYLEELPPSSTIRD